MNLHALIPLAAATILAAVPAAATANEDATLFVCEDERGDVVYQSTPCPKPHEKPVVARERAAAPRAKPAPVRRPAPAWTVVPPKSHPPTAARLGKQEFPLRVAAAPPSFDSPSSTWRTFLAALDADDGAAAASCLTPTARDARSDAAGGFPVAELRRLVRSFVRIDDEGDLGVYWSLSGVRADRRPKWILFEETERGVWKIAAI